MAKWKEDPQGRDFIEEVTEILELPIYTAQTKGRFRPWLKESWGKVEDKIVKTVNDKQDKNDKGLETTSKEVVGAINELNNLKQDKQDSNLLTDAKTVVGAINELKEKPGGEKLPIGTIVPFASEIIPLGYLLCDGREIQKKDYPELFEMLPEKQGKRYLPDLRGQFLRGNSAGRELLSFQGDAIRNIQGEIYSSGERSSEFADDLECTGAFKVRGEKTQWRIGEGSSSAKTEYQGAIFDASLVVPTANENRPKNISVNYMIKATNIEQSEDVPTPVANELNGKIESNRVALDEYVAEVREEFKKRDEIVVLWESATAKTGTFTLKENIRNFDSVELITMFSATKNANHMTAKVSNIKFSDTHDGLDFYQVVANFGYSKTTFRKNGLNFFTSANSGYLTKIIGIGRVSK